MIQALAEAMDAASFGGKAVQLGAAIRAGLPVPAGFAVSFEHVEATVCGDPAALAALQARCPGSTPCAVRSWAVRSSAIGEDAGATSFAGTHLSVLGVCGFAAVVQAIREVHASGQDPGAHAYRARLGLERTSRMAVVVQELVDADVAGVLFTRNPVTGAAERVIEASWGLGEAVVSGLVTPDQYRLTPTGCLLDVSVGEKDLQIRRRACGGTEQVPVAAELICARCLGDGELAALHALATTCDRVFESPDHDIEFAFRDGAVFLLQRRPITSG